MPDSCITLLLSHVFLAIYSLTRNVGDVAFFKVVLYYSLVFFQTIASLIHIVITKSKGSEILSYLYANRIACHHSFEDAGGRPETSGSESSIHVSTGIWGSGNQCKYAETLYSVGCSTEEEPGPRSQHLWTSSRQCSLLPQGRKQ